MLLLNTKIMSVNIHDFYKYNTLFNTTATTLNKQLECQNTTWCQHEHVSIARVLLAIYGNSLVSLEH